MSRGDSSEIHLQFNGIELRKSARRRIFYINAMYVILKVSSKSFVFSDLLPRDVNNIMLSKLRVQEIYREELQKAMDAGLPIPKEEMPERVEFMKSVSIFGECRWSWGANHRKRNIRIRISEYHLVSGERDIRETLAHEICHACPGKGHGQEWQAAAEILNRRYGYRLSRLQSHDIGTLGLEPDGVTPLPGVAHLVKCPGCGRLWPRARGSRLTLHPERYRCPDCKMPLAADK